MPTDLLKLPPPFDSLYLDLQLYGSGAEAEVFAARYTQTGERVAIKVLKPGPGTGGARERDRARFVHEATQLRAITHPHVARVFELLDVELRGQPTKAFVMEWLPETLRDRVGRCPRGLPAEELERALRQALSGLGALHEAGVAVRDLRPENLLLTEKGVLKIADLGMARTETEALSLREQSTRFQAPEVLDGSLRAAHRPDDPPASAYFASDLYSLGFIFYEAAVGGERWESLPQLAGVYGKEGMGSGLAADRRWEQWHTDRARELPAVGQVRQGLPPATGRGIDALVRKDRAARCATVQDALDRLGGATPKGRLEDAEETSRADDFSPPPPPPPPLIWRKILLGLGLLAAVVVVALGVRALLRPRWAVLTVTPPGIEGLTVQWRDKPVQPREESQTYVLRAAKERRLVIAGSGGALLDTVLTVAAGQNFRLDLSWRLPVRVTFELNVPATIKVESVGEKQGQRVEFALRPGLHHYEATAAGYVTRRDSVQVSAGLKQPVRVALVAQTPAAPAAQQVVPQAAESRSPAPPSAPAVPAPTGTITVSVEPAGLAAPWKLRGPNGYQRSEKGSMVLEGRAVGSYTLTWQALAGYQTPSPATRSRDLQAGGSVEFRGQYAEAVAAQAEASSPQPAVPGAGPAAGTRREWTVAGIKLAFRWIPPGKGQIGSPAFEPCRGNDEAPFTAVFTRGFWLQETEMTQAQWSTVAGSNPSHFKGCPDCPVEGVSWDDVQAFLQFLNTQGQGRYRLPTEAEWEYAARSGSWQPFGLPCPDYGPGNCGGTVPCLDRLGWYSGNSGQKTHPVGAKEPNAWGLRDMVGNVWEWVADWYGSYPSGEVTNPVGPGNGSSRVLRGGSWNSNPRSCRVANRNHIEPGNRNNNVGFRCVRDPD